MENENWGWGLHMYANITHPFLTTRSVLQHWWWNTPGEHCRDSEKKIRRILDKEEWATGEPDFGTSTHTHWFLSSLRICHQTRPPTNDTITHIIAFFLQWEYVAKLGHQQMPTLHISSWQQEVFSSTADRTLLENTTADNLKHISRKTLHQEKWATELPDFGTFTNNHGFLAAERIMWKDNHVLLSELRRWQ